MSHAKQRPRPSHESKGSSSKHTSSSRSTGSSSKTSKLAGGADVDFLFVVNEIDCDPAGFVADAWGNLQPPVLQAHYGQEIAGSVFRYQNGHVTLAQGHFWFRGGGVWTPGRIGCNVQSQDASGNYVPQFVELPEYSTSTVFDCGPFFPCAYVNVDASIADLALNSTPDDRFYALHFDNNGGVSRMFWNGGEKQIASGNASWLGTLVPRTYRNLHPNAPRSSALGGELGPLLGLMALAELPGNMDHAFPRHWNGNRWTGTKHDNVSAHGPPRGVVVHVAIPYRVDPAQARANIHNFEWAGAAVTGGH